MRLIDADEVMRDAQNISAFRNALADLSDLAIVLCGAQTIDAVPVKRGTWKFNNDGSGTCDQCHFTQKAVWDFDRWQNFCGVCGADMRERKDGDE